MGVMFGTRLAFWCQALPPRTSTTSPLTCSLLNDIAFQSIFLSYKVIRQRHFAKTEGEP